MGVAFYSIIEYKQHDRYVAFGEVDIPRGGKLLPAIVFGNGGMKDKMLYPPRGMPSDISPKVLDLFFTDVATVEEYLENFKYDDEDEPTVEEYVEDNGEWAVEIYKTIGLLPEPELYDSGWLTYNELQKVLLHEKISIKDLSSVSQAAFATMESLAQDFGAENVRLVFWCGM